MYNTLKSVYYKIIRFPAYIYFHHIFRRGYIGKRVAVGNHGMFRGGALFSIGNDSFIGDWSIIEVVGEKRDDYQVSIGRDFSATGRLFISSREKITIGNHVLLANNVRIYDSNHGMNPELEDGYENQPLQTKPVCIEDGVWCGDNVMILAGAKIGAHSVIGAGSIVTGEIPAYSVAVGAPARVIKKWDFEEKKWKSVV